MDLHFCSRCGISIPQAEVDTGSAGGSDGKYFCSEHRGESAVAVAERPGPGGATGPGGEPELLFCANCRVSIPHDDAKSGRAHREFGSLLCAGCSKADPGERAARREAVEAEMAADVEAQDPVVARRCSVCSAVVPYGQIVTGKAKVEGNQVVCERCRAVATTRAPGELSSFPTSAVVVVVVLVAMVVIGYLATQAWLERRKNAAQPKQATDDLTEIRGEMERRASDLDSRLADLARRTEADPAAAAADRQRLDAEFATLRQSIQDATDRMAKSDAELQSRIARLEGQLQSNSEFMRSLASRPTEAAPPAPLPQTPSAEGGVASKDPGVDAKGPAKPAAPVNPEVTKACKDLLESSDDGIRFNAARTLGDLADPAAIPTLVKALADDKHYFVRRACAIALAKMKSWLAVPALIRTLEDREPYVALAANNALQKITGNDFGITQDTPASQRRTKSQSAEKWWDKNKDHPPEGVSLHPITD
jgi:HEAT repeat protein